MNKALSLYRELHEAGVSCFSWTLGSEKAATIELKGAYALFVDFDNIASAAEEAAVIAHEYGHIATGTTHRVCSPYDLVERHEHRANKWAIEKLLPRDELYALYADGLTQPWEIAEHAALPEDFVRPRQWLITTIRTPRACERAEQRDRLPYPFSTEITCLKKRAL